MTSREAEWLENAPEDLVNRWVKWKLDNTWSRKPISLDEHLRNIDTRKLSWWKRIMSKVKQKQHDNRTTTKSERDRK